MTHQMIALFESPVKCEPNQVKYYPIFEGNGNSSKKRRLTSPLRSNQSNTCGKSSKTDKSNKCRKTGKRRLPLLNASKQYAIDFGQKDFDAKRCKTCNMLFTTGEVIDEKTHEEYHDVFVNSLKFNGWKNEDTIAVYEDGRVIRVLPTHKKFMHKKVNDLFTIADLELGIRVDLHSSMKSSSVYLIFVAKDKRIAGFVAAEGIKVANELISEEPFLASTDEQSADCGVARLWTHPNYRRLQIATRLLDNLRTHFIFGKIIEKSKIAFSDPTINGKDFAKYYTGKDNFLIYQYQN